LPRNNTLEDLYVYFSSIVDGTTCIFAIFFAPFVYYQFLRRSFKYEQFSSRLICHSSYEYYFFSSQTVIPQIIYADESINPVDSDNSDDGLIDPGTKPWTDHDLSESLDGHFDDITSSTRVIPTVL
jgi:hypothetical protein